MYGFYNKLLRVNLSGKTWTTEEIPDQIFKRYFGGKGLGSYLLNKEVPQGADPLGGDNKLIFTTGPATGTKMMGVSRYGLFTKSPLTGIYSESYSGGHVAPVIKKTGYDAIIIEGVSEDRIYLEISDTEVRFHSAAHLWGKETYQTEDSVLGEVGVEKAQAVVIGPAGENLVRFACIENNYWRSAGRTGVGAVMGSKNLKAIVFHGQAQCDIANPILMENYVKDLMERGKENPGARAYRQLGTPMLVKIMNSVNGFPTRYWQEGFFDKWENISADYMQREMDVKPKACDRCFFACGKLTQATKGRHKGLKLEGPEYETIYAFGGLCCIDSMEEILYLNDICDRLGMDTITAGNLAAFTIEAGKRGAIHYPIEYGDAEAVAHLLHKISQKKDIGEILAEGIVTASKKWGLEDMAIHVKGLEPAGYDPRILKGMGLAYATSDRGACHLRTTFYKPELSGIIDPDTIQGKAELLVEYEDRLTLYDALILCRFFRDMVLWEDLSTIVEATMGLKMSKEELRKIASNITNETRKFNIREGVTAKEDSLPPRFFQEPIGPEQKVITPEQLRKMLSDYYRCRGWNEEGIPL
ncbi:MAG: aldehyde ferredoxin oxidoreductase family protein, partial [Bacillota bacterium]|nr:aldehyde ferredoxin oxidoreductase family protein [Bacillota bacterium]